MDQSINQKITYGLERIAKAFRVLLWEESKLYKISPIQIQILLFCASHKQENLKVSFLANEFDLTKATISDSVKVLIKKELLLKKINPSDSRSFAVKLTKKGNEIVNKAKGFTSVLNKSIDSLTIIEKENLLVNILSIIYQLNQGKIISTQRMCLTCFHYEKKGNTNYCNLLETALKKEKLQIDCPDHKMTA
ncbi:MarR family winged helix-turn-helix transcriptional regulator [Snuella lapsa]|uniref:MarR family winged helix-turn-helix transcriptional regulator n=1 Tax=Snuella lapsa TaxID=870481 RepID=A0ABP6X5B5_9FLAO